jgi:hypothetical protein
MHGSPLNAGSLTLRPFQKGQPKARDGASGVRSLKLALS